MLTPSLSHVDSLQTNAVSGCHNALAGGARVAQRILRFPVLVPTLLNVRDTHHSGLSPANLTTLPHFPVSDAMKVPN